MSLLLIRHGRTQGNIERRYIGSRTDEPLCQQGIKELQAREYLPVDYIFASPMKRCLQTAEILYPNAELRIVDDLRECDFGDFENLSYQELNGRADYQAWIDSGGELPFPNGESRATFAARSVCAFKQSIEALPKYDIAFVVHGGTIMSIMEAYARPKGTYFDFQVSNGDGYLLEGNGIYQRLL
ncbi:MAG: histidine phosphatase family protein [Clostridiales bacterium]|nr:histidine phosphatase family protein [Clostridiales bacterium]